MKMKFMLEPDGQNGGEPDAHDGGGPSPSAERLFAGLLEFKETVFRICLGFCRDIRDAEELTQDVYVKVFAKLGTLRDLQAARAWLFRITRNICLNHLRRMRPPILSLDECDPVADSASPEQRLETREQLQVLKQAISTLPRRMREVFVMREYGQLRYEEIAGALGLRPGTVMSRLSRARTLVSERMRSFNDG